MKRTAAFIVDTGFLEFDVATDDLDRVQPIFDFRDVIFHLGNTIVKKFLFHNLPEKLKEAQQANDFSFACWALSRPAHLGAMGGVVLVGQAFKLVQLFHDLVNQVGLVEVDAGSFFKLPGREVAATIQNHMSIN